MSDLQWLTNFGFSAVMAWALLMWGFKKLDRMTRTIYLLALVIAETHNVDLEKIRNTYGVNGDA